MGEGEEKSWNASNGGSYEGEGEEGEEIDPTANGEYGHLKVDYKVVSCDEQGCGAEIFFNGVVTDRAKRKFG
jgi:hypothetical protein